MERRRLMGKQFAYIIYSITNVNKKYGNSSFVNPLSMSGDGTVTYTSNNTAVATIDSNGNVTIIAPGEAIITASVEDTLDFEYENNSASYTLIVAKADGNVSEPPTPKTIVYDGDDHQLINAGTGTGTMLYKFDYDEEWDEIIPTASESGTYTIQYKSSENQYYTESSIGTIDVTIQKAQSQYIAPTPISPLIYNTNAQNLLNEGSTNDGLIQYSIDEINWSTNVPQGTNAGEYRVYWKLVGDYNHTDISSTLITIEMDKVTPTVTPPCEGVVIPYDGEIHELIQCGSTDYGTLKYSLDGIIYSTTVPTASAMDDYIIYWMVEGNSNINDIEPATVQASISGIIVQNPTINLEYNQIDYDGTAKQPSVEVLDDDSNIISSSEYTVTYSDNVNVGTATVTITDVIGGTYIINGTKTFTINSIDPIYIAPTAKTGLVYNEDSQLLLNSGSVTTGGTMYYSSDEVTWSENNNHSETNAGTYNTYWKIIGDNNYNDISSTLIQVMIDKAPICQYTAPTHTSPTYNCNAQNLLNAGSEGCGTMQYSSNNSTWSTTIPQGTNVGTYTSYWRIIGDNNHYGVDSTSIQTTISKCTPTIVAPTAIALTYNGSAQVLANAGSITSPSCASGMEYSLDNSTWSSSVPSATNGGAYTVYYRVQGNSNINGVSGNIACSIGEKPVTATVTVSPTSYEYDGTAKQPTVTVKDGNTTIPSSEYTVTYSNNVNAGTATVTITDKTGGNWNVIGSTTFTITQKEVCLTWGTLSWTYDGSAHSTTCTVGCLISGDSCSATLSGNSITNKGTTTVTATGLSNSNYKLPSSEISKTLTISGREVTYKANDESWTYDGNTHSASNTATLTSGSLVSGHSATFSCSGSIGAGVGSATKTLSTVTIKSGNTDVSGNYTITRNNGTLTINAKPISIPTPTNYSGAYDGNAHTATFGSATGASITKYRYSTNNSSWTESTSNPSLTNVGTLYTQAYYTASTNYTGSNWSSSTTITISRAKTASASAANKTYNGTTESNGTAQTGVSGSYVSWSGTTSAINAGGYTAYATPDSNHAWSDGTTGQKTISWTMNRRGQTAPTLNAASTKFHGTATASIKSYGTVADGTAQAPGSIVWENQSRTALGSQNARAYHAATATNFSASGWSSTVAVTITAATDQSVSVTRTNRTWNNSAQVLASATSHGCTYYLGFGSSTTSVPSSWGGANSSISATNVGTYYIWYKATKDGNHSADIGATYSGTAVISKSDNYSITATPTVKANTYNGQAQTLLQGGSANIAGSFSYSTYTNAATGLTGTWTFTPTDSTHYNTKSGSVSGCYINRATCSGPTVSSRGILTYNRSAQSLATVSGNCGTMHYRLGTSGSWITSIPTATDIGSYTVYWYMDASTNYNGKGSSSSPAGSVNTWIQPNYINLGFTSGTLWSYTNVGSANEGSAGNYYMYGYTSTYNSSNSYYTGTENPLATSRDAAYKYEDYDAFNFGSNWRTPMEGQLQELLYRTTITEVTANGNACYKFTGPNGNYIIIPKAGYYDSTGSFAGGNGQTRLWSSTPGIVSSDNKAYVAAKNSSANVVQEGSRLFGYNIRPVRNTIAHNFVDLGLPSGRLWADCNIGASIVTDVGYYFSWGNVTGHTAGSGYSFNGTSYNSTTGHNLSSSIPANATYDAARYYWGGNWRMPTADEFKELYDNTTVSYENYNNRKCIKFTHKTQNTRYIVLPCGGAYNGGTTLNLNNTRGYYWASTYANANVAYQFTGQHDASNVVPKDQWTRAYGLNIRPVM